MHLQVGIHAYSVALRVLSHRSPWPFICGEPENPVFTLKFALRVLPSPLRGSMDLGPPSKNPWEDSACSPSQPGILQRTDEIKPESIRGAPSTGATRTSPRGHPEAGACVCSSGQLTAGIGTPGVVQRLGHSSLPREGDTLPCWLLSSHHVAPTSGSPCCVTHSAAGCSYPECRSQPAWVHWGPDSLLTPESACSIRCPDSRWLRIQGSGNNCHLC